MFDGNCGARRAPCGSRRVQTTKTGRISGTNELSARRIRRARRTDRSATHAVRSGMNERCVAGARNTRDQIVRGPLRANTSGGHLRASGVSPLSFAYFSLRRQRKVSAAPHRGNANKPIRNQGEANALIKHARAPAIKQTQNLKKKYSSAASQTHPTTPQAAAWKPASAQQQLQPLPPSAEPKAKAHTA
jgi:hypothetical protein